MDNEFWRERWKQNQIGFHQQEYNPYLLQFWKQLGLSPGDPVFVPLCGKTRDMCWLAERGFPVLGVEISRLAVEAFYREQGATAQVRQGKPFDEFRSGIVRILCGDFYDLSAKQLEGVRGVYDRASLVALPPSRHASYVKHLSSLLTPGTVILLVTLHYPTQEMQGPPFPVSHAEVQTLFEPYYKVEQLHSQSVLEENPRFQARGLSQLTESVYRMLYQG